MIWNKERLYKTLKDLKFVQISKDDIVFEWYRGKNDKGFYFAKTEFPDRIDFLKSFPYEKWKNNKVIKNLYHEILDIEEIKDLISSRNFKLVSQTNEIIKFNNVGSSQGFSSTFAHYVSINIDISIFRNFDVLELTNYLNYVNDTIKDFQINSTY
jgi:hypothetical protein